MARRPAYGHDVTVQRASHYKAEHPGASSREIQRAIGGRRQDILTGMRLISAPTRIPRELRGREDGGTYRHTVTYRPVVRAVERAKYTRTGALRARYERETREGVPPKPEQTRPQRRNESATSYNRYLKSNREAWDQWRDKFTQAWADRQELVRRLGREALEGKPKIRRRDQREAAYRRAGQAALDRLGLPGIGSP